RVRAAAAAVVAGLAATTMVGLGGEVARAAATFTVNNVGTAADAAPGNGVCATAGAVCTLRAAIQEANALAGADTIQFNLPSGASRIAPTAAAPLPAITEA